MAFDLVLLGGSVVTDSGVVQTDIGISGGQISQLGNLGTVSTAQSERIDGLTVFPGVIDTQVHFREPGLTQKEDLATGTLAAICGGVTSILEMPNTDPPTTSKEALEDKLRRAEGRASCDYGFFVGATAENADDLARLERLTGTPGIKIFMGSSTGSLLVADDETLERVLRHGTRPCPIHAEDHARLSERKTLLNGLDPAQHPFLRDAECARLATTRIIDISRRTGRPVHILHVSTGDEPPLIAKAKTEGVRVTAEITPQHLYFSAPECYAKLGTLAQMNPPLRDRSHRDALRRAFQEGVFDVIGSDHAPHTLEEKALPYPQSPSGMPGVQTLLPVMLTLVLREGLTDLPTVARMTSSAPASLYGTKNKGGIVPGHDADLSIVDLESEWIVEKSWLKSKCGWSPYEGERLIGKPIHTLLRGQFAVRNCEHVGAPAGRVLEFG